MRSIDCGARYSTVSSTYVLIQDFSGFLFPSWYATPWEFYGHTDTPQVGSIACGYFVSTTLKHTGYPLDRFKIAKMASLTAIKTLAKPDNIIRYPNYTPIDSIVQDLQRRGDGLYLVGLAYHIGYIICDSGGVDFCHSSYVDAKCVCRESVMKSRPFWSSPVQVVGKILDDSFMEKWLLSRNIRERNS